MPAVPTPSRGLFFALTSAASYGLMSFLLSRFHGGYSPEQLVFIRNAVCFAALLPFCRSELHRYFRADAKFLWVRSIGGAMALLCYYYSLQGTISANANLLFSTTPVFVGLLSWLLFRERITRIEGIGIALILLSNLLLYLPNRGTMPAWVWLVGGAGALFASISLLSLGVATKTYSSSLIVFGLAVASMALSLITPTGRPWIEPPLADYPFLLAVSVLGLAAQILATLSFFHLKSSIATSLGRSSILFSGLLELVVARYHPHPLEWASYIVMLVGVYYSQQKPRRTAKIQLK